MLLGLALYISQSQRTANREEWTTFQLLSSTKAGIFSSKNLTAVVLVKITSGEIFPAPSSRVLAATTGWMLTIKTGMLTNYRMESIFVLS